jgi:hypothetical protein
MRPDPDVNNDFPGNAADIAPSPEDNKLALYLRQKALLDTFLGNGAITRAQYEKSLGDLTEKMGMERFRD